MLPCAIICIDKNIINTTHSVVLWYNAHIGLAYERSLKTDTKGGEKNVKRLSADNEEVQEAHGVQMPLQVSHLPL